MKRMDLEFNDDYEEEEATVFNFLHQCPVIQDIRQINLGKPALGSFDDLSKIDLRWIFFN